MDDAAGGCPEDYVVATGISKSMWELVDADFKTVDLDYHD